MSNDHKFKMGLALAREQELIKQLTALNEAVAPIVADFQEYDRVRYEPLQDTFQHPANGHTVENGVTVKVRHLRALSELVGARTPQKYDDTLVPFLALMRKELHANSHKGDREGWLRMTPKQALEEIRHHEWKLAKAIEGDSTEDIPEYAADVANCAMMVADVCGVLGRA